MGFAGHPLLLLLLLLVQLLCATAVAGERENLLDESDAVQIMGQKAVNDYQTKDNSQPLGFCLVIHADVNNSTLPSFVQYKLFIFYCNTQSPWDLVLSVATMALFPHYQPQQAEVLTFNKISKYDGPVQCLTSDCVGKKI
ncbi:hypothetical protein AXF42_Ash005934 [Apostasia shenzhenica]|uniref:Uncharacterized protein n=1 Tax=Apostasia shenzhenica TaxID=1088818 RepID=A0A2I0AZS0_9ASPA|nr:hypothetical protein AXF42_Ash005934 [Apostasia shenzhenica]